MSCCSICRCRVSWELIGITAIPPQLARRKARGPVRGGGPCVDRCGAHRRRLRICGQERSARELLSIIRQVASGVVFHVPSRFTPGPSVPGRSEPGLTEREQTILAAVAAGMTTAAISGQLWVSGHTIKFHLTNIYRKIGVSNRAEAVRYALENGFASTPRELHD